MNKTTQLKNLLRSDELTFICEAHNGLSAKIVEEAGFAGIWGSGLSISAAMGVRDNNEASWTQVLDVLEFMSDATSIPILLDGDTGYGNFNNMRRLVKKLEQRDVAGVCIEDKLFPKTNSFIRGEAQPLAEVEEFCGKIKAGKDTQSDDDFCIVARTEAFIAGWGLAEALRRADAYYRAGADAILVHSKVASPKDILAFSAEWHHECPIVIVPTMYYSTPTDVFREARVSMVIWANHMLRTSVAAMQQTARTIAAEQSLVHVEEGVVSVKEIFRLQGDAELRDAEKRYLPKTAVDTHVVVLAATKGRKLGTLTDDRPKCMVPVNGKPVLVGQIERLNAEGLKNISVVTGYKPEVVEALGVTTCNNPDWESTGELGSLLAAESKLNGSIIVSYGDTLYQRYVLSNLLAAEDDITVVVDSSKKNMGSEKGMDWAKVDKPHQPSFYDATYRLQAIDPTIPAESADGEWIGLVKCTAAGTEVLKKTIAAMKAEDPDYAKRTIAEVLTLVVTSGRAPVAVQYTHGDWLDLDDLDDLVGR
jgi:phosphoenolpyruvate phosphomutase